MTWFKVDDGFHSHPKALTAGTAALGLWTRCGSWSSQHLTDGFVPENVALLYGTRRRIKALLVSGLWERQPGGYAMTEQGALWCSEVASRRAFIPPSVRTFIYDRDGYACCECGTTEDLSLDHIFPWSLGGLDHPSNLRTLCRPCNSRKGARV